MDMMSAPQGSVAYAVKKRVYTGDSRERLSVTIMAFVLAARRFGCGFFGGALAERRQQFELLGLRGRCELHGLEDSGHAAGCSRQATTFPKHAP
eukprot:5862393-Pyramimonas_sp.AAC.1